MAEYTAIKYAFWHIRILAETRNILRSLEKEKILLLGNLHCKISIYKDVSLSGWEGRLANATLQQLLNKK